MFLLGCSLREEAISAVGGSRWPPVELKSGLGWEAREDGRGHHQMPHNDINEATDF